MVIWIFINLVFTPVNVVYKEVTFTFELPINEYAISYMTIFITSTILQASRTIGSCEKQSSSNLGVQFPSKCSYLYATCISIHQVLKFPPGVSYIESSLYVGPHDSNFEWSEDSPFFQMRGLHAKSPINWSNTSSDNTWHQMKQKCEQFCMFFFNSCYQQPILL